MNQRVNLLDVINLWLRVGRNTCIPVSLCEKNLCMCEENWCTRPLKSCNSMTTAPTFKFRMCGGMPESIRL